MKKWFFISLLVIVIDQLSKYWAMHALIPYQAWAIFPGFNFTLAFNTGVAFSFLSHLGEWNKWLFSGFSLVMSIVLIVWLVKTEKNEILQCLGISLILGGAIGNLIDRLILGYVIDFIELYFRNWHWPVFNLADSAICVGAVLLLLDLIKASKKEQLA